MNTSTHKISVIEKIGYSLGDLAANLIFQTLMTFLAFFYTDVYKIEPNTASAIIFIGGMIGAFFNPVMGIIADRTSTRWGKFRPWILWTSIPFGIMALLAFSTPNFGPGGKVAYAMITYVLLVLVYSANNLPYSALSGVMTGDMAQRNSISSYRFIAVTTAQFIIQVILLPLVLIVGKGDQAAGFETVMGVFAAIGVIFFIITFLTTKERIVPSQEQKTSIKQDFTDLFKNKPWIAMLVITVFIFITLSLKGGAYVYYFKNYLNEQDTANFLNSIGFNGFINGLNSFLTGIGLVGFHWPEDAPTSAFSLFNASGIILMIIAIALSKPIADKYGKRDLFGVALTISAIAQFMFFFISPSSIGLVFLTQIIHGFFYGLTIPLLWAMIADVADYSEWKNNRRATAIIFSAMIFGLKAGLAIGGALVAGILSSYGYDANLSSQSAETTHGILLTMSIFPTITFFIAVGCLFFYEINKTKEVEIEKELKARRASASHTE
ncbi:sugar (glycoside-pentoside-hexuronide) transporter [Breznakibacter xylanolyticus]|uniref:Sugar (Glycoside-pentoside-hexuronide) transporter n=1 Tax=Breznakibacter xylanolyticus TaxID=990 RepID=A0A2W7NB30_9BACT|nr:MFS transporter [Breznakibacter xylanolyticus]MBN2742467.1 MFS transporter [Marinilabiliaceae bacterium]PZX16853.1 sugar (glycoside-pentoside-hexuronide) transporter [Breznakibacter xylanolyticus]